MAVIQNGDLSLEIGYRDFEFGCVTYDVTLRWRGEPVLNDAILKRSTEYWANRGIGSIKCDSDSECGVLPLLQRVLETNKGDFWEPDDPDIRLIIHPGSAFSFLETGARVQAATPEENAHIEVFERERRERKPTPGDCWEVIVFIDAYNFVGSRGYYGTGPCFCLAATREDLQRFYTDLQQEYRLFRAGNS